MAVATGERPHALVAGAKTQHQLGQFLTYLLLMLGAAIILVPLYWMKRLRWPIIPWRSAGGLPG